MVAVSHAVPSPPHSQLKYDGFETAAAQLMEAVPKTVLGSSERLGHLVKLGLQTEGGE